MGITKSLGINAIIFLRPKNEAILVRFMKTLKSRPPYTHPLFTSKSAIRFVFWHLVNEIRRGENRTFSWEN